MATTTDRLYNLVLDPNIEVALREAMFGDGELMSHYSSLAVLRALTDLTREVGPSPYSPAAWGNICEHIERARAILREGEEEMVEQFSYYSEPPF